ncbi:MAG: type II toxin-antitoxin system HicB family antitoxin [Gammaproteobacteria bacterium]|nr:type II toxin-antitoxin system HicB family antitoxin [Gammaproteobacteria bacterium]
MHKFIFPAKFKHDKEEGGFIISFRDIPEAITEAETIENGFIEATDCLEEAIAGRIDDGLDIPKPSKPRRSEHLISVPAHTAIKAALYLAMVEKEVNKSELARRLNVDVREVRRMLNPYNGTKLPAMEQALEALGKHIELHVT